jgi:hypothetical protein
MRSSFSTKLSTVSIPSRVTEASVAWKVWTSGIADALFLFGAFRDTLNPLRPSVRVSSAAVLASRIAEILDRHSASGCF